VGRIGTLLLAGYSYFLIKTHLPKFPAPIPTQFDSGGVPHSWGWAHSLWGLWVIQIITSLMILTAPFLARYFPYAIHLGLCRLGEYSPAQRARIMPLVRAMAGYISALCSLMFVYLIREVIRAASMPHSRTKLVWPLALFVVGTTVVLFYYQNQIESAAEEVDAERTEAS
jgi:uncharacterized membrane protein